MRSVDRERARFCALTLLLAVLVGSFGAFTSSCTRDHGGAVQVGPGECYTCHVNEYETSTSPPHPGLFPNTCGMCHTETEWIPAMPIDHPWFPLQNRHLDPTVHCSSCHGTEAAGYAPGATPNQCEGCHMDDYDGTTMPPHPGSLPTTCATCHTDAGWVPSTFMHSWPLDGAHAATPCASCHVGTPPVYTGTPRECNGCHAADRTTADGVVTGHAGYELQCQNCHTTTAWRPAIGGGHPETEFPISRGAHGGITCLNCHDASLGPSTDGMNTNCIGCHEHSNEAGHHREVAGYAGLAGTSPHFCLECHPRGRN